MIPQLEKGCCGCTLHTSSLVIAWLQLFWSGLLLLITCVAGTAVVEYIMEHRDAAGGNPEAADQAELMVHIVLGVLIVLFLAAFLIDLFLLIGVFKRNYCLMMPYLIFSGIGNSLSALGCVILFFAAFGEPVLFGRFVGYFIQTALGVYFWLIVYSYFKETKTQSLVNQNNFNKI